MLYHSCMQSHTASRSGWWSTLIHQVSPLFQGQEGQNTAGQPGPRRQGTRLSDQPTCVHIPLGLVGVKRCNWEHNQNEGRVGKESSSKGEERVVRPACMKMKAASTKARLASMGLHGASDLTEPFSPVMWSSLTRQLCAAGFLHQLHGEEFPFPRPERGGCGIFGQRTPRTHESALRAQVLEQGGGAGPPKRKGEGRMRTGARRTQDPLSCPPEPLSRDPA